jgi:hypothetical protein
MAPLLGPIAVPKLYLIVVAASATAAVGAAWECTPLEIQRIQVVCTLVPVVYATHCPEIFGQMFKEGQTKIWMQPLMCELLVPYEDDMFNAIHILVSEEMVKDFLNLDFGFNRDTSYST